MTSTCSARLPLRPTDSLVAAVALGASAGYLLERTRRRRRPDGR